MEDGILSGCRGDLYCQYVYSAGENVYFGVVISVGKKAQVLPEKEVMQRMRIYRMTEFIYRWSMVDILSCH